MKLLYLFMLLGFCREERFLLASMQMLSHVKKVVHIEKSLVQRGHHVYVILADDHPLNEQMRQKQGFQVLTYERRSETPSIYSQAMVERLKQIVFNSNLIEDGKFFFEMSSACMEECKVMMQDQRLMHQLKEIGFTMAVIDGFPLAPCHVVLPFYLNIPFVLETGAFGMERPSKSPVMASFQPHPMWSISPQNMVFWQRIVNSLLHFFMPFDYSVPVPALSDMSLIDKYAPQFSSWKELIEQAELFITTRDHLLDWPTPYMPNVISVPGLGAQPAQSLEKHPELVATMQSLHGAIVVSFGSSVPEFPKTFLKKLVDAFARVSQQVVFRYPFSIPSTVIVPDNVYIYTSWMPQNDLLGNSNTTLFITHCGNNGQYESLYHGVPMIGIPMFAEQYQNCHRAEAHGYGLDMKGVRFSTDDLVAAINEVNQNPLYRNNTKRASLIMKKAALPPMERVAIAIETVMELGGNHLRSAAYDLHWTQYALLDVALVLCIVILILAYVACSLANWMWSEGAKRLSAHAKSD
ncbi:hypothetical protein CAPTEDRAFT_226674 [Capitella teleta]|uniref:UDP-glucuronosyltransferase n=1 Tax=Capitella teleta TaxID=283909 RepID=R7TUZ1_CAPTE|nr:hypothetical protein CAPTEDRAFT_226674 [Capitella teleta]|eukprot:ELT97728.1 hypothetical protein CAPTEDRAFT_226674 [Capitella teleta]